MFGSFTFDIRDAYQFSFLLCTGGHWRVFRLPMGISPLLSGPMSLFASPIQGLLKPLIMKRAGILQTELYSFFYTANQCKDFNKFIHVYSTPCSIILSHGGNTRGVTSEHIRCCYHMGVRCCPLFYKSQKCGEGGKH
jgi:hypothetical protein